MEGDICLEFFFKLIFFFVAGLFEQLNFKVKSKGREGGETV